MGEHPVPGQECRYGYQLITRLENRACTLGLDLTDGVQAVLVSALVPPNPDKLRHPCLPRPVSAYPLSVSPEKFFYSHAILENVAELKLCRAGNTITGIVLRYLDGAEESLGWVREGALRSMQKDDNSAGLWLLISASSGFPRVTNISLTLPLAEKGSYFTVQWHGKLEWWFSRRQCQLFYEGNSTQETRCQLV